MTTRETVELHIVSDSTGETAARLVAALEAQFPDQPFEEVRHPQIQTIDDLQLAVSRAKGRPAVMVYTLVDRELRESMRTLCRSARLHYCDLLGHPIESIAKVSGMAAKMTPGARPPLNSTYFKRMEAIEFAVKFDDGVGSGLQEADIVLVGVSRTSKTPLSIYLGYLGQKAANVPIVKGIKPPPELFEIDPLKIVGLTIDAERLAEIRATRARGMGGKNRQYAEMLEIYDELEEAAALHRRLGCPVIEVTGLSIEETAHRVVRLVDRRRQEAHAEPKPPVPEVAVGALVDDPRGCGLHLLRAADPDLARPPRAGLGGRVALAPARRPSNSLLLGRGVEPPLDLARRAEAHDREGREPHRIDPPVPRMLAERKPEQRVAAEDDVAERLAVAVPELLAPDHAARRFVGPGAAARRASAGRARRPRRRARARGRRACPGSRRRSTQPPRRRSARRARAARRPSPPSSPGRDERVELDERHVEPPRQLAAERRLAVAARAREDREAPHSERAARAAPRLRRDAVAASAVALADHLAQLGSLEVEAPRRRRRRSPAGSTPSRTSRV